MPSAAYLLARLQKGFAISVDRKAVEAFCDRWRIVEFSFFGSVLTESFGEASDIDVLVAFEEDADWSLFDIVDMREELCGLFGRPVDLIERKGVERSANPIRRRSILEGAVPYLAR